MNIVSLLGASVQNKKCLPEERLVDVSILTLKCWRQFAFSISRSLNRVRIVDDWDVGKTYPRKCDWSLLVFKWSELFKEEGIVWNVYLFCCT